MTCLSRMAHAARGGLACLLCTACSQATPPDAIGTPTAAVTTATAPVVVTASPTVSASPPPPPASPCPADMAVVEGSYCARYELTCLRRRKPWQCAEYDKPGTCSGDETPMRFCIDRYEYPNRKGAIATVMNSWNSAKKQCEDIGKRLCTDAEWTLACEGSDRLAFPYGYVRDSEACAIDKSSPKVNERRLFWKQTQDEEVARLDQREPSGSRPRCVSSYGVYDLTGNVDEWVVNETGRPYKSSLKGGNWGEYRNACRPTTRGHDEGFYYYQTGFRCCADLP